MSKYIDVNALLQVAGITLVVAVGMVLFFSLGVVALNGPAEERTSLRSSGDGSTPAKRPTTARIAAAAAFAACAALAILGLIVLIQK